MDVTDLNLLIVLDALLAEESVTGAARRLGLSASAVSRSLSRLRLATGDPLLASAGRRLVPTPHAVVLRQRVRRLVHETQAVLRPTLDAVDPRKLDATFTIRASQSFMESSCAPLVGALKVAAPKVRLHFVPKPDRDLRSLREGMADLEIGIVGEHAPEIRTRLLFRDKHVGIVRNGHPLLTSGRFNLDSFVRSAHVAAAPRAGALEPVDLGMEKAGLKRDVVVVVPGYPDAMRVASATDLVSIVPRSCLQGPSSAILQLIEFELPVEVPEIVVFAMWHPRLEADPAHRWLRDVVSAFFASTMDQTPSRCAN